MIKINVTEIKYDSIISKDQEYSEPKKPKLSENLCSRMVEDARRSQERCPRRGWRYNQY